MSNQSRAEELLTALINGEQVEIEPRSRAEKYLNNCVKKCGCDDLPTPRTRIEALYYQLAEQLAGGGGGSGGGDTLKALLDATKSARYLCYYSALESMEGLIPYNATENVTTTNNMFDNCFKLKTVALFDTSKVNQMVKMFNCCSALTTVPLFDTSNVTNMASMFYGCSSLTTVPQFDTSNVIDMSNMFYACNALTTVPQFDTSSVTTMSNTFYGCRKLTEVPLLDTSKVTSMSYMFQGCEGLTEVPLYDTSKVTNIGGMFQSCPRLVTVPAFDLRSVTSNSYTFNANTKAITGIWFRNIKTTLQVSDGTSYGHLLTIDSLIHLVKELRDTGSSKTLTMATVNLDKLANVYVRTVTVTDEMRAEDDLIDEKLACEVCESTDEGAMTITEYATLKNWILK